MSDRASFTEQDLQEVWRGCANNFDQFMRNFLLEATPISFDDYCLKVKAAPFVISRFSEPERKAYLNQLIVNYTGIPTAKVEFIPNNSGDTHTIKNRVNPLPPVYSDVPKTVASNLNNNNVQSVLSQFNPNPSESANTADTKGISLPSDPINSISINEARNIADVDIYAKSKILRTLTFDTFVRGDNNNFALATALAVANNPGQTYNPLFFYSGVGLGKTHLMHAIGNNIIESFPNLKVLYIPTEQFTNEYIELVSTQKMDEFHNKYRNVDVLLIDDIQFLENKTQTQEEFFHTFEHLRNNGKQIVVSSDRPPNILPKLTARMTSRLSQGVVADIQPPKLETRIAILRKKAQINNFTVPEEILEFIAESYCKNIRELEGALTTVMTFCSMEHKNITLDNAKEALKINIQTVKNLDPENIIKVICDYFDISEKDLTSNKRDQNIVKPRQLAMYLIRTYTDLSLESIGKLFNRNHTTVLHGVRFAEDNPNDSYVKNSLTNLRNLLKI